MVHKWCCVLRVVATAVLVVVKELSICCYSDVQRVSQSTHVPGEFAGLADEWLDDGEGCVRWKEDLGATVQSPNNISYHSGEVTEVSVTVDVILYCLLQGFRANVSCCQVSPNLHLKLTESQLSYTEGFLNS